MCVLSRQNLLLFCNPNTLPTFCKYCRCLTKETLFSGRLAPTLVQAPSSSGEHPLNLENPILSKLETCRSMTHFNQIHALIVTTGMFHDVFVASRLLVAISSSFDPPNVTSVYLLFTQIQNPDVYSYNILMKTSSRSSNPLKSLFFYHEMLLRGLRPNEYTFCFVISSCASGRALQKGKQVHSHIIKCGFHLGVFACTSLLHMYSECGDLASAYQSFVEMPQRSEITWGAMIGAYVTHGCLIDGLRLFAEMSSLGIQASNATLVSALNACAQEQDLVLGRMVHGYVEIRGLELNVTLRTSLVDMYCKCGAIQMAMDVFSMVPTKSAVSWNCAINGLAMNSRGDWAIDLFESMRASGMEPNGATFVGVLQACSHAGLVDTAVTYFSCMSEAYRIEPTAKHYGCMVDLYGRAGRLEEAVEVIRTMPIKPDAAIWGALLGGCRIHGETRLGELAGAQIMKLQPPWISGYTNLSDMYAMAGRWDCVIGMRRMMEDVEMGREAGYSSIN